MNHSSFFYAAAIAVTALCLPVHAMGEKRVSIDDGDVPALLQALCDAQDDPSTVITLAHRGHYAIEGMFWDGCRFGGLAPVPIEPSARVIIQDVRIKGNHATIDLQDEAGFEVRETGQLTLEYLEIRNGSGRSVVLNDGRAELTGVSVLNAAPVVNPVRDPSVQGFAAIDNRGAMIAVNSTIAGSRLFGVPAAVYDRQRDSDGCETQYSAGLKNSGDLTINNMTFLNNRVLREGESAVDEASRCLSADLLTVPGASTRISNSVLDSRASCEGDAQSLGYNSVRIQDQYSAETGNCKLTAEGDTTIIISTAFSGVVDNRPIRQFGRDFYGLRARRAEEGNPAQPGTTEGSCNPADARGYFRGDDRCLRGAFDNRARPNLHPGLDGFWFDPANDGHYVQISHYGIEQVLLMWTTFDGFGQREWIYGLGPSGATERVEFSALVNEGAAFVDGVIIGDVTATPWGAFSVFVESCDQLQFGYEPLDVDTAPQQITLRRVTVDVAADCPEGPELE